jgi:HSP20 family protein
MFGLKPWRKTLVPLPRFETPFGWMPEEFSTLFNRLFTNFPVMETPEWRYPWGVTTEEKEKELVIRMELPGFEPEELKVEVLGEVVKVEAEHKVPPEKVEENKETFEREYAHVKREIALPPGVELEKAEAIYRNGILEVHVPRKPGMVGRRLEVKA